MSREERHKRNCDFCKKYYEGCGKRFCSRRCKKKSQIGGKHSEEHKRKIGLSGTGRKMSKKSIEKIRISRIRFYKNGGKVWCDGLTAKTDIRIKLKNQKSRLTLIKNKTMRGEKSRFWKGGTSPYPYGWNKLSKALRELRNNSCEICKSKKQSKRLYVHHKDRNKMNSDLKNLIVLCSSCHREVHPEINGNSSASRKSYKPMLE